MLGEVFRRDETLARLRQPAQVAAVRHQHALSGAYASRDEAAVLQIADTHRHVDALLHQVDEAIAQTQVDLHLGMPSEK